MKILHVIPSLSPLGGGPVEGLIQLVKASILAGNKVDILTLEKSATSQIILGCEVHCVGPAFFKYRYTPNLISWLSSNANKYDAIIVEGLWQYHSYGTWKAIRNSKTPYYVFIHGMLSPWFKYQYPIKHLKKIIYWSFIEKKVLRDARSVFFTSEDEKILAEKTFGKSNYTAKVVGYGISAPILDSEKLKDYFLNKYEIPTNKKLLLFLGRIDPVKGVDLLINAFAYVAINNQLLHLVIAGPGKNQYVRKLKNLAEKLGLAGRITWTGMIEGNLKWGAYYSSEGFCLPSHQENFGVVVAEALACGVPVLISDKVNTWRQIRDENAGFVNLDTIEGTIQNLREWIKLNPVELNSLKVNALVCFRKRFHVEEALKNLITSLK